MIIVNTSSVLASRRILVVEDEPLVAMLEEDLLLEAGAEIVGPATSVAQALTLIGDGDLDGAVLDVNLGEETAFPVAERLTELGVPFVFVTGYGRQGLIERHAHRPVIRKPFKPQEFAKDVAMALMRGSARAD